MTILPPPGVMAKSRCMGTDPPPQMTLETVRLLQREGCAYFPWLGALLIGSRLLAQTVKRWYTAQFDTWL
jgi:hypothetical protein